MKKRIHERNRSCFKVLSECFRHLILLPLFFVMFSLFPVVCAYAEPIVIPINEYSAEQTYGGEVPIIEFNSYSDEYLGPLDEMKTGGENILAFDNDTGSLFAIAGDGSPVADITNEFSEDLNTLVNELPGGLEDLAELTNEFIDETVGGFADGLNEMVNSINELGTELVTDLTEALGVDELVESIGELGADVLGDLTEALGVDELVESIGELGADILGDLTEALGIDALAEAIGDIGADILGDLAGAIGIDGITEAIDALGIDGIADALGAGGFGALADALDAAGLGDLADAVADIPGVSTVTGTVSGNCTCSSCTCVTTAHTQTRSHFTELMKQLQQFITHEFASENFVPATQILTEQMTVVALHQMMIVGAFFDAKHQLESQRLIQKANADIHKEVHPSKEMCSFGTGIRAMSGSERKSELTTNALSEQLISRQLLNNNRLSKTGSPSDYANRIKKFKETYCDSRDNDNGLGVATGDSLASERDAGICRSSVKTHRKNRDINYTGLVEESRTLDIDFSDNSSTEDEEDVIFLQNYLFGHNAFRSIPKNTLKEKKDQELFLDFRAIVAKRSVLTNAYNNQVGLRSKGSGGNDSFFRKMLKEVGASDEEIKKLGASDGGLTSGGYGNDLSYYAQLKTMVKNVQSADFYAKLYETPENVQRMGATLQALELQIYHQSLKSDWRREMITAIGTEIALEHIQKNIEDNIPKEE